MNTKIEKNNQTPCADAELLRVCEDLVQWMSVVPFRYRMDAQQLAKAKAVVAKAKKST